MKVKMTNISSRAVFVPEQELVLDPGEGHETEVEFSELKFPEMGWYLSKSFEITIQRLQAWTRLLREVKYSWMRIGPPLMSVRI